MQKLIEYIKKNCDDLQTVFVFQLPAQAREWFIRSLDFTGKKALPESMFISWNIFRREFFEEERDAAQKPVSQIIRKIFAQKILRENAEGLKKKKPIFNKLILEKYAETADNFVSYIVDILPQLENFERKRNESNFFINDYADYAVLKRRYESFLREHTLYESNWGNKKLKQTSAKVKIIFPELIEDFYEVKDILEAAENIELISVDALLGHGTHDSIEAIAFDNTRNEIEFCVSSIEQLLLDGVPANEIAVSVYRLDELKPYIKRDAELRGIPIEFRAGTQLGNTQIGKLFTQIAEVENEHYSFAALNELFLNIHIPWKNKDIIQKLLRFGIENNCVVSWEENGVWKNVWLEAFKLHENAKPLDQIQIETFFLELKQRIDAITQAKSFAAVKINYDKFCKNFFDEGKLTTADDVILSRCIELLKDLKILEEEFSDELSDNRFNFFADALNETNYVYQNTGTGVSVFPCKVMAVSPFKYNFILNANQKDASVIFQNFLFLRSDVRSAIGAKDIDVSADFLQCYSACSGSTISFSAKTFSDYAIIHGALMKRPLSESEQQISNTNSFINEERFFYCGNKNTKIDFPLYEMQMHGAKNFLENFRIEKTFSVLKNGFEKKVFNELADRINDFYANGIFEISTTQLTKFTGCPALYFFETVLGIEKEYETPTLFTPLTAGILAHQIIEDVLHFIVKEDGRFVATHLEKYSDAAKRIIQAHVLQDSRLSSAFAKPFTEIVIQKKFIEVKALLTYFAECYDGYTIPIIEQSFTVEKEGYNLVGKVDCALSDMEQGNVLIDFKSKGCPTKSQSFVYDDAAVLNDFQIAMYVYLLEEIKNEKINNALFWSLAKKTETKIIDGFSTKNNRDEFELSIHSLLKESENFYNRISEYNFSVGNVYERDCYGCRCNKICRTIFQVEGE